jgi:trigger factor
MYQPGTGFKEDQTVKVTTEKLEGSRISLEVECSYEVVNEGLSNAYKKLVRKVTIPGFRRGKAPKNLVERYYGAELYDEAIQEVLPREYIKAVEDAKINPVDDPEFSDIHFVKGEPLRFKATVYVLPEVTMEDCSSISVPFESPSVSEEDVDKQIDMFRERMAELRPMDEGKILEAGHYATCHVKSLHTAGHLGEESHEDAGQETHGDSAIHSHDQLGEEVKNDVGDTRKQGGKPEFHFDEDMNYVEVGREYSFVPGLGQALIGMKKGEAKEFEGTYPAKDGDEPKRFRFQVEVKEVYSKYVPEDIDEIARNLGKASGEEIRAEVKKNLMALRLQMAREQHADKVEEQLFERASVEIPEVMIARRTQTLLERFQDRLGEAGMKLENYLESTRKPWEDLKAELEQEAEKDVKRDLILDAIGEEENTQVSEESIDKVVESLAAEMGQDPKAVRTTLEIRGALDDIKNQLKRIETLNAIAAKAAINAGTPLPAPEEPDSEPNAEPDSEPDTCPDSKPEAPESTETACTGASFEIHEDSEKDVETEAADEVESEETEVPERVKEVNEGASKDAEPGDMVKSDED